MHRRAQAVDIALAGPLIIDAKANAVEESTKPPKSEATSAAQPREAPDLPERKIGRPGSHCEA